MSKTYQNSRYPGFMRAWESLLGKLLYIAVTVFISAQIAMFAAPPVQAASEEPSLKNPPSAQQSQEPEQNTDLLTKVASDPARKQFDLEIDYTETELFNPKTGNKDKVKLRSYIDHNAPPSPEKSPLVAPTIRVAPGDSVRISLDNKLPEDPSCNQQNHDENVPHCFNSTNLHTHGLWISPSGNSDNVLLSIKPGEKFQYEYHIPPEHPAGTFWYHPHRHGSTALQVSSGMAGALIVEGDRLPSKSANRNGDIDTLLKEVEDLNGKPIKEEVLVLQQIQYACPKSKDNDSIWECDPSETGTLDSYKTVDKQGTEKDLFSPSAWSESGRYTSINGEILPTITATNGGIQRWRMIHGGVRNTINLAFRKYTGEAPEPSRGSWVPGDAAKSYIKNNCQSEELPYYIIADDGLTRSKAWRTISTTLQPGYQSDALVLFPKEGYYCVVDGFVPAGGSVTRTDENAKLLGWVKVEAVSSGQVGEDGDSIDHFLTKKLTQAADKLNVDSNTKTKIKEDLNNGLKLSLFTPHRDIKDNERTGKQELTFYIDLSAAPPEFKVSNSLTNSRALPYDSKRIDRTVKLGQIDEWKLQSHFAGHPFHIHVNPFQIVAIYDPYGRDVSGEDAVDWASGIDLNKETNGKKFDQEAFDPKTFVPGNNPDNPENFANIDPEYRGLKGVWRDTIWVKAPAENLKFNEENKSKNPPNRFYTIVVRTHYQRYIGDFVMHCHILDHEDQGMMQNVSIELP